MQSITKVYNYKFRLALTIALALGGLAFPFLFLPAAFVGWTIIHEMQEPPQKLEEWVPNRYSTTADDPDWINYFLQLCESPAETAFLEAMIVAYNLTPNKGALSGNGLTIELQVEMKPYRTDFLVNKWLVVEIDGAAYHSSPQAIARDKVRDEFMQEGGYSVLRIPAKVVFDTPDEAVHRVRSTIARGNQVAEEQKAKKQSEPKKKITLMSILDSVNSTVAEVQKHASLSLAVDKANQGYMAAFHAERLAIEKSIENAESEIKLNEFLSQSEAHRESYLNAYARYKELLRNPDIYATNPSLARQVIVIPPVPERVPHPDPLTNQAIERTLELLVAEREKFFSDTRDRLNKDDKLKVLVRQKLADLGCEACWKYIA